MLQPIDIKSSYRVSVYAINEGKMVNEDIGDWLIKKVRDARTNIVTDLDDSQFLNVRKNAFKQIMRGQYHKALGKMERYNIKYNSASPNGIKIFGHRFEKLPFVLGAIGYTIYNRNYKRIPEICEAISTILSEVFGNSIDVCLKMKSAETPRYNDLLSFCLSWGAKREPNWKSYREDDDTSVMELVKSLVGMGWNPGNILQSSPGFLHYIMKSDFVETAKYLSENKMVGLSSFMVKQFGLNPKSRMAKYLNDSGEHPFRLHEPDVVLDRHGRIASDTDGMFAAKMSSLGYMIAQRNEQPILYSTLMALQDELAIIIQRYTKQNHEKISNPTQINIFKGSNFDYAKTECKKLVAEYNKAVGDASWASKADAEKQKQLSAIAQKLTQILITLQKSVNPVLKVIGLPPISIKFNTDISRGIDSSNIIEVMKELGGRDPAAATAPASAAAPSGATTASPAPSAAPASPAPAAPAPTPTATTATPAPSATT